MTVSQPTPCRSCRALIRFIPSASSGAPIPVDDEAVTVVLEDGQVVRAWVSHFATCPNAAHHRKRGAGKGKPVDHDAIRAARAAGFEVTTDAGVPLSHHHTLESASGERDRVARTNRLRDLRIRWKGGDVVTSAEAGVILRQEREERGEQQSLDLDDPRPNSPEDVGFRGE